MANVSVIKHIPVNSACNVQVVFMNPTKTTKKCYALLAIGPAKTHAHRQDRKVAWHVMKDG